MERPPVSRRAVPGKRGRYMGTKPKLSWAGQEGLQMALLRCYDVPVEGCPCSVLNLACAVATSVGFDGRGALIVHLRYSDMEVRRTCTGVPAAPALPAVCQLAQAGGAAAYVIARDTPQQVSHAWPTGSAIPFCI